MRHSAMWVWLVAATALVAAVQRPGLSAEVQNPRPVGAEVTVAQSEPTEDRKAEANHLFRQGTQRYQRSQFREAIQSWEAALAIYQAIENQQGQASVLNNLGLAYGSLSDYRGAIARYEQALSLYQALEDRQGQASVLNNLSSAYQSLSDYRGAIAYLEQALPLFQALEDRQGQASVLNNLGSAYRSLSDYRGAIAYLEQALSLFQTMEDRQGQASALSNLGNAYGSLSDYRGAIAYLEQALPLVQAIEDRYGQASVLINLGTAYLLLSDYQGAIAYYEQALPLFQAIEDRQGQANVLGNLGLAYWSLSDFRGAIAYLEQALPLYQAIEDRYGQANALGNLGIAYLSLGDYQGAIVYYEQALPLFQTIEDRQGQTRVLGNLGLAYLLLGNYREAIAYFEQVMPLFQAIEDRYGQARTLTHLGNAYLSLNDHRGAVAYYEQALPLFQATEDHSGESTLLSHFGALLAAQDQPELAIAFYKVSVNLRESIRAELQELPQDLQNTYTESISGDYRELVRLLLEQDRVLEAQQVLELLRVQEIDEYLRDMRGNAQTAEGLDLWEAERQLLAIYMEMVEAGQGFEAFLNRPEVQAFTQQLQRNARGQNLNPETLVRLQNDLKQLDNAVLLYPLILEDRLELVLVTPEGLKRETVAIDRVQLNQLIATFRTDITGRKPEVEQSAQQLYDLLIRPLAPYLGETQTILYAADGQLRYIPLAALHDGEQWLAQRFNVNLITAASLTDWGRSQSADLSVLAGAFSEGNYQVKVGDKLLDYNGLPYAGLEVERIATDIPSTKAYFNQDFSRDAVESQLGNHSIVHFATHAEFVVGTPHESFILFGNGDRVTLPDIANWSLPDVDLVVLSACQTAVSGELGQGEEILGFGYQIQRTGARAAIASLWYVNDGGTQVLMNAFYTALQNGYSPAEALRLAQQALIEGDLALLGEDIRADFELITAGSEPSHSTLSHPYYWAPFILIGNGL